MLIKITSRLLLCFYLLCALYVELQGVAGSVVKLENTVAYLQQQNQRQSDGPLHERPLDSNPTQSSAEENIQALRSLGTSEVCIFLESPHVMRCALY